MLPLLLPRFAMELEEVFVVGKEIRLLRTLAEPFLASDELTIRRTGEGLVAVVLVAAVDVAVEACDGSEATTPCNNRSPAQDAD